MLAPLNALPTASRASSAAWRGSFGLAIILVGQPIAWTVRGAVGGGINPVYPLVATAFGFALLLRIDWFKQPRFYPPPRPIAAFLLLWLLPLAALSLIAPVEEGVDGAYALFFAVMLFGLALTPVATLHRLPEAMTIVGGVSSFLPLISLAFGHSIAKFARLTVAGTDNQAIAGSVGGATMIAALLVVRSSSRRGTIVGAGTGVAFIFGLAAVVLSNTRSVMLFLMICLPLVWFYFGPRLRDLVGPDAAGRRQRRTFAILVAAALVGAPATAAAVFRGKALDTIIVQFGDRLSGAFAFLEPSHFNKIDTSSAIRIHILDYTWRRLDLVGHGLSEQIRSGFGYYPHLTYLQAFYDFGIAGGLVYLVLALVIPIMLIFTHLRRGQLNPASAYAILLFIYALGDQFSHTTPYAWNGLAIIGLIYVIVCRNGMSSMSSI